MIVMEPALRGVIEQAVDDELSEEMLRSSYRIFLEYRNKGLIDSVGSAMFGRIYTRASSAWIEYVVSQGRRVKENEAKEFGRIFEARAMEIRSKITQMANL